MKRTILFGLTNIAVLAVVFLFCQITGINRALAASGSSVMVPLIFAAVIGMGGAWLSLLMSKTVALKSTGARVLTEPSNSAELWLFNTVQRIARTANIGTPDIAVYESASPNAFATGANKNSALIAVSTGLLRSMTQEEVEAVLGHEMGHIANGDMVTLTLIQGVVNTFVNFGATAVASLLSRGRGHSSALVRTAVMMILQVVLGFGATLIVAWFSRRREFSADRASAHFCGKRKMIAALTKLKTLSSSAPPALPKALAAFGVSGLTAQLFATHPPLDVRIAALNNSP